MKLDERKLKILQAIIADFVSTAEPVGSRTLSKKYNLGVSPATIRNEMSDLEDMGFLTHLHTSSGRVPSEKAYRLYVNELMKKRELSAEAKEAIAAQFCKNINELDDALVETARVLSEITKLTSFAMTPNTEQDILKYINIQPIDRATVLLTIVANSGQVSNVVLENTYPYTKETLKILAKTLTYNFKGKTISQALKGDIISKFKSEAKAMGSFASSILPDFVKTLEEMLDVELYMDGLSNIFDLPEYNNLDKARMFLETLSKTDSLTKVLSGRDDGIIITIGDENDEESLKDYSLITATYHIDGEMVGKLGVIGPTRMKYDEITSIIEYLTDNLTNTFSMIGGSDGQE